MVLYILFHRSGTPVGSQLVFHMHFCVWRCIPDVSVERDVLHVHLLLCQLVLSIPVVLNGVGSRIMPPWGHVTISGMSAVVIARGSGEGSMASSAWRLGELPSLQCPVWPPPHRTSRPLCPWGWGGEPWTVMSASWAGATCSMSGSLHWVPHPQGFIGGWTFVNKLAEWMGLGEGMDL